MSEKMKTIMDYDTVALDEERHALAIIDQTQLPYRTEILYLTTQKRSGMPFIFCRSGGRRPSAFRPRSEFIWPPERYRQIILKNFTGQFQEAKDYLDSSRPTAVNLSWALKRQEQVVLANRERSVPEIVEALHQEALNIREEDIRVCRAIGENGLTLVKPGDGLLTHCNAGKLAAVKYGTATAPMYLGQERGYGFRIYADETRPLLQGARLTAYELQESGLDVTLLCDNMSAAAMRNGWINAVFVGCDRVAANGDTANKIGTSLGGSGGKKVPHSILRLRPHLHN